MILHKFLQGSVRIGIKSTEYCLCFYQSRNIFMQVFGIAAPPVVLYSLSISPGQHMNIATVFQRIFTAAENHTFTHGFYLFLPAGI